MADIRKREGRNGTTYQVRYPSTNTKSGYTYASFKTMKAARAFVESGKAQAAPATPESVLTDMMHAVESWLRICEKEGLNGREPVTHYTLKNYEYRARFITDYRWPKPLQELTTPDIVAFRSWLLRSDMSRVVASKVLSTLHSVMKELVIRGHVPHNPVAGVSIRTSSRYKEPVIIPTRREVVSLLQAADSLANSKNRQIARTWERYRPILYLAADSGMRPQEYLALSRRAITKTGVRVERAIDGGGFKLSVTKTAAGRRTINLSPDTLAMVRHYAEHHAIENDYDLVFPAQNGRWQCRRNWQRRGFDVACEKAGLVDELEEDGKTVIRSRFRPYDLRHFYASMLIHKQINLKKIQKLMGHESIETTLNVYGHLLDEAEDDNIKDQGMLSSLLT